MPKSVSVEELLGQDGIEIPDDPLAIEQLLSGQTPGETDDETGKLPSVAPEGRTTEGEEPSKAAEAEPDQTGQPAKLAEEPKPQDPPVAPKKDETDDEGPPKFILRRTRESLHEERELRRQQDQELEAARRRIAELESSTNASQKQLQETADRLTGDPSIKLEKLDRAKLDSLRQDLDDDAVDFLGSLVDKFNTATDRLESLERTNQQLVDQREQLLADQQQADIDAVPLLAGIQATRGEDANKLWALAAEYEKSVGIDPDFRGKSRAQIYQEVGRKLERYLGDDVSKWTGSKRAPPSQDREAANSGTRDRNVEDELARARERATPDSLSDLPAGAPAAQSEMERLDAMSMEDLQAVIDRAITKGQLDETIARLSTIER